MAENENSPKANTETEAVVNPETDAASTPAAERRSRRERPPRAERVKPERQPRERAERQPREKPERPERVRPERPERVRAERTKPERVKPSRPPFELGMGPDLGKEYDRMMKSAFNDAAKAVEEQFEALLPIPAEIDPKEAKEMDRTRKSIAKTMAKALGTFGTRLMSQASPSFDSLTLDATGKRALAGPSSIEMSPAAAGRFVGQVTSLRPLIVGEEPALKKFQGAPEKLEAAYGNSLENNYFLTGAVSFSPNYDAPEDSEFSYSFDLFAKRGKEMGMRLQFSVTHNLNSASFKSELRAEIPLQTPAAETPAKKAPSSKTKKTD